MRKFTKKELEQQVLALESQNAEMAALIELIIGVHHKVNNIIEEYNWREKYDGYL